MAIAIQRGDPVIRAWQEADADQLGQAVTDNDVAFARPDIDWVEIHHDEANVASSGVPKALGYTLIGEEPHAIEAPAATGVHWIWRVTRAEWVRAGP